MLLNARTSAEPQQPHGLLRPPKRSNHFLKIRAGGQQLSVRKAFVSGDGIRIDLFLFAIPRAQGSHSPVSFEFLRVEMPHPVGRLNTSQILTETIRSELEWQLQAIQHCHNYAGAADLPDQKGHV